MLKLIDLRGQRPAKSVIRRALPRGGANVDSVQPLVEPVVEDVRAHGAAAALDYGEQFDGIRPYSVLVPQEILADAEYNLDPRTREAISEAIIRIRKVHAEQKPQTHTTTLGPGAVVTEKFLPIDRVGLYVPGGQAVYPSSVLMNVIPAQEAGVRSLVVASPPQAQFGGWPHPSILAACHILGVSEVWAVGGAQAVALLAYGDEAEDLDPVGLITGPGNIFVTAAKRFVRGIVGTDGEAGPTEIAVLADGSANPIHIAYDLISQAEHDEMAASILITDSEEIATEVANEVASRYEVTRNSKRVAAALNGEQSGIVLVSDLDTAVEVANQYGAEHLEIHTRNSHEVAGQIKNAGAIFVGQFSPVPLGDYAAGSNHVLPTAGTARFSAGLSTHTFLRPVNFIEYDKKALEDISDTVVNFADAEDLPAHGEAVKARFD